MFDLEYYVYITLKVGLDDGENLTFLQGLFII